MQLSVLDLAPIASGSDATTALRRVSELARHAEALGYHRFWLAEHHGLPSIASAAPEILIEHVASRTERIRVGSGGVMLPNHAPLAVAERYLTLEALHPGRIDLGVGRAAGTTPVTAHALRSADPQEYPQQLREVMAFARGHFPDTHPYAAIDVVPSGIPLPPMWLLGSSGGSAELAGRVGAGYAFAHHFSPTPAEPALRRYRESFVPSAHFPEPRVMLAVSVFCAETTAEAERLASATGLMFVRLRTGNPGPIPSPEEAAEHPLSALEKRFVQPILDLQVVGDPATVKGRLQAIADRTGADELMISTVMHDPEARLRSYQLVAEAFGTAERPGSERSTVV
ncbi:MAG: LLM class flavin-dependent oxidoreductase [Deltaproteobacteria bacterium]|nr:LLM class flavin-dependent oxidoreductase [Deltaproteobacteria bacterium]